MKRAPHTKLESATSNAGNSSVLQRFAALLTLSILISILPRAFAQAPSILWTTNIGATLFAVDNQTNSYANVGGSVIVINANGVPVSTNVICPLPGLAQRDAAGNYYFSGNFDGTQNFGGITLVGGWTNFHVGAFTGYTFGYPTHFITKYTSNGTLVWAKSFGPMGSSGNQLRDLLVDSSGAAYAAHTGAPLFTPDAPGFTLLDTNGVILWSQVPGTGTQNYSIKLGGVTSSNFCYLYYNFGVCANRKDFSGNNVGITTEALYQMPYNSSDVRNGTPTLDNSNNILVAGRTNASSGNQLLRKFDPAGSLLWTKVVSHGEQWSLTRDASETFYFGSVSNDLIRYDVNGNERFSAVFGGAVTVEGGGVCRRRSRAS